MKKIELCFSYYVFIAFQEYVKQISSKNIYLNVSGTSNKTPASKKGRLLPPRFWQIGLSVRKKK